MISALLYGRNDYSPQVRDILAQYGDKYVVAMEVRRTPLGKILMATLNVASFGQIAKNNPYDTLYHLSLVVRLEDGTTIMMEKNEVISMEVNPPVRANTDTKTVALPRQIRLNQILQLTKNRMGDRYFLYSARDNNCGDWVLNILQANRVDTPELTAFVKQDARQIFADNIRFRKLTNTVTDFAGRVDVLRHGAGLEMVPYSLNNGLTNFDIEKIMHQYPYIKFGGVYMKDMLPTLKPHYWYVANMQNEGDGDGTHWVCLRQNTGDIEYFDAFGFPPALEILKHAKQNVKWSPKQIQDINSTACGYYCIARMRSVLSFEDFVNQFSDKPKQNDVILSYLLKN